MNQQAFVRPGRFTLVKKIFWLLAAAVLFLLLNGELSAAPLSGSYTINSAVVTGGTNFQSFNAFADSLNTNGISANVTVTVVPGSGPYNERVNFNTVTGASASAQVTLEGSGETITAVTTTTDRHVVRLTNVQYFTINNLKIEMGIGSAGGFYGIHVFNMGSNITISNCEVLIPGSTSTLFGGYILSGSLTSILTGGNFSNIIIDSCFSEGGGYGVSCYGLTGAPSSNVVISNNTLNSTASNAIYVHTTNGTIVRGNSINFTSSNGIQLAGGNNVNCLVEKNRIAASNGSTTGTLTAIVIFGNNIIAPNKVINNVIWNMKAQTANVVGINAREGGEFYFNTVILDDTTASGNVSIGFEEDLSNTGSILKNNIFYITRTSANYSAAIALTSTSPVATAVTSDHNVAYVPNGHFAVREGIVYTNPPTNAYTTLAAWQVASGEDANSFEANPGFVSSSVQQPTNGLINDTGTPITGVTDDITGTAGNRATTPDPGAYEFTPAGNDAAITAFIPPSFPYCNTSLNVQFVLANSGASTLNSVTIDWTVNGAAQTQVTLNALGLASGADTVIALGTVTIASSMLYNFTATASMPNGTADGNPGNDSYTITNWRMGFSGAYTIDNDNAPSATNYQSFQLIADALAEYGVCGPVTINAGGTSPYTEQVIFTAIPGASAANTVTLNGNATVLQFDAPTSPSDYAGMATFVMDGVSYLTVDNLTVNALDANNGAGFNIIHGTSFITISNCSINIPLTLSGNSNGGGILASEDYLAESLPVSTDLNFTGNTITGGSIFVTGDFTSPPDHHARVNIINNTLINGISQYIYTHGTLNVVVRGNDISSPTRTPAGTVTAIDMYAGSFDFIVEGNRVHDIIGTSGIYCIDLAGGFYPASGVIRNNLIYNITNTGFTYGIQEGGGNAPSTGEVEIYHNTIVLDAAGGTGAKTVYQWDALGTTPINRNLKNNIFVINSSSTGNKVLIDVSQSANGSKLFSDNNVLWFGPATAGTMRYGEIGGTLHTSFASWQAAGQDLNSVNTDPLFANPGTGNFRPTEVAINNIGAAVGVTEDILGLTRSLTNPDPGAYEFGTCNPPAAPGAITGDTVVCQNEQGITYSIAPVGGVTTYNWTVPAGATVVSGQGTTTITVDFLTSSGNISVAAEDTCGLSAASTLAVTVSGGPGVPSAINGPATVCTGAAGVAYSATTVAGATSYAWTAPAGATINGQGNASVTIDFGATSGAITVQAGNDCGTGTAIALNVTVGSGPAVSLTLPLDTVCNTSGAHTLSGGSPAGGTYSGNGVSNGVFFAANAGPGNHTITYSYFDSTLSCAGTSTDNIVVEICPGIDEVDLQEISVYPNPFSVFVTVEMPTVQGAFIILYDPVGKPVLRTQMSNGKVVIDRGDLPAGVYMIVAQDENKVVARKMVVLL